MRILIENGCYHLQNLGDVAMLQTTVARLARFLESADIHVITDRPDLLNSFCPNALPMLSSNHSLRRENACLVRRLYNHMPQHLANPLRRMEQQLWMRQPQWFLQVQHAKSLCRRKTDRPTLDALQTFLQANAVIVSGGGDLNDAFPSCAHRLLDCLDIAQRLGKITALFGQGIGPVTNPDLRRRMSQVLPKVSLIGIRESLASPETLVNLGVNPQRLAVTGDDAIEPAYDARNATSGSAIGVNLRFSGYSELQTDTMNMIGQVLREVAGELAVPLLPIPISLHEQESDLNTIENLLDSREPIPQEDFNSPAKVIQQVGRCRLVVTGSYHGAVFALAQGIPCIPIAKSSYYTAKFTGLLHQFACNNDILSPDQPDFPLKLAHMIRHTWTLAPSLKTPLQQTAQSQITAANQLYQRFARHLNKSRVTSHDSAVRSITGLG